MGTTAGGLPYPEPTDPIAEGADAIKALAEAIERCRLVGSVAATSAANGVCTVTFGQTFASAPTVIITPVFGSGGTDYTMYLIAATTTGFTARLFQAGSVAAAGVTVRINYLAVGVAS
jgi:hypothetical protein